MPSDFTPIEDGESLHEVGTGFGEGGYGEGPYGGSSTFVIGPLFTVWTNIEEGDNDFTQLECGEELTVTGTGYGEGGYGEGPYGGATTVIIAPTHTIWTNIDTP